MWRMLFLYFSAMKTFACITLNLLFVILSSFMYAQAPKQSDASELMHKLQKLQVLGKVLYVAAHPDDENTRLIAWLSNERKLSTAYLSLTRGEGGQNLIGAELGNELGWIRMHELLQARKHDGGSQYFSRASDFGYSKSTQETIREWNKDKIMEDIAYVIRHFQPDIVITRFSPHPSTTHAHHTASAMLTLDVAESISDTNFYYLQLNQLQPWQPQRILWNTSSFFFDKEKDLNKDTLSQVDVGTYIPLLGKSCTEIAAQSRSCHKSQGFGVQSARGEMMEYFIHLMGSKPTSKDPLSDINFSWSRLPGAANIQKKIKSVIQKFKPEQPHLIVSDLLSIYSLMHKHLACEQIRYKMEEVAELIRQCLGVYVEISTTDYIYAPGDSIRFQIEFINRSAHLLSYINVHITHQSKWLSGDFTYNKSINESQSIKWSSPSFVIDDSAFYKSQVFMESQLPGTESYSSFIAGDAFPLMEFMTTPSFNQSLPWLDLSWKGKIVHKKQDPVYGEIYKPVYIAPPVTATPTQSLVVFPKSQPKTIAIELQSFVANASGHVELLLPAGWKYYPQQHPFTFKSKREKQKIQFTILPPDTFQTTQAEVRIHTGGQLYAHAIREISYAHIPHIVHFPKSEIQLVRHDLKGSGSLIGYLPGAGDGLEEGLTQSGYQVERINHENLTAESLAKYKTVLVGIRAFNIYENSPFINDQMCQYVYQGGTVILQYITTAGMKIKTPGPYELQIGRGRVTDQNANPDYLIPQHPVFHYPHTIDSSDWQGWVQEKGLYFAEKWDTTKFQAVLSIHDKGEKPHFGALLIARYGKGLFVYTGLSFFRQIPHGVPGAYKILINLIEINSDMLKD